MRKVIIIIAAAAALFFSVVACDEKEDNKLKDFANPELSKTDSFIMDVIYSARPYSILRTGNRDTAQAALNYLYSFIDSMENRGEINAMAAAVFRAHSYELIRQETEADDEMVRLYRVAMSYDSPENRRKWYYNFAGNQLSLYLYMQHNYEGFLRLAVPLLALMDSLDNGLYDQRINLYSLLASCYVKLGEFDKAKEVGDKAGKYCWDVLAEDPSLYNHQLFINSYARIKDAYVREKDWEEARYWLIFVDSVQQSLIRYHPDARVLGIYGSYLHLDHAIKLWSLGQTDTAATEYAEFNKTVYANTLNGLIQSNDYLMNAERWEEAATHYEVLDWYLKWRGVRPSLEEMGAYYIPKLRANYYAGRKDSALQVAMQIAELYDSSFAAQKRSQMAKMATIYDMQGKEMEIAHQKAELSHERWIGTLAALGLITTFFIIYTLYRRRAEKRLEAAHVKLQQAYDQLEETTTAKERIESELRIARNIQMSMVPNVFPEREGLDMFASMVPAKEVGGDLYGYFLQGDSLYFCVGDVSGKGVPASLFMAQSARLFRTFASEGMAPADIAVRMNDELSEGNDNNMFVTMFIGLIHLDSGQLDFCNCGHNPPVIDGQFLQMTHVNQPIGIMEGLPFRGEMLPDIRGHQLLIYTDGLTEAENPQKALLGDNRLIELMADAARLGSHEVIDMLTKAVEQHRSGAEPSDDLTLMCITLLSRLCEEAKKK